MWRLLLGTMGVKSLVKGLNAAATAGFEPRTVWSKVRRRNRLATAPPLGDAIMKSAPSIAKKKKALYIQNILYALNFHILGLYDLLYVWNFHTVADRCGFFDLLCTFRMEAAYEIYENNMHTKTFLIYSTPCHFFLTCLFKLFPFKASQG